MATADVYKRGGCIRLEIYATTRLGRRRGSTLTLRGFLLRHCLDEGGLGGVAVAVRIHVGHIRVHVAKHAIALLRAGSLRIECGRESVTEPGGI